MSFEKSSDHFLSLDVLPPEILTEIVSHLKPNDLVQASLTCRALYDAVHIESVWERRAQQDFGVKLRTKNENHSAKMFYQKVLHPYGGCLGLWQRQNFLYYGDLTQIVFDDTDFWKLRIFIWDPPPDPKIDKPLRLRDFLTVQLDSTGHQVEKIVHDEFVKTGECQIELVQSVDGEPNELKICLNDCPDWTEEPDLWNRHLADFMRRQIGNRTPQRHSSEFMLQMEKYLRMFHARKDYEYSRLDLKQMFKVGVDDKSLTKILKPGIFKGTYGPHGIELISLTYRKSGPDQQPEVQILEGTKLTGDPNVPMNEVTFRADLSQPLLYTNVEDQSNIDLMISEENLPTVGSDVSIDDMRQVFQLPTTCRTRAAPQFNHCLARYKAECQVAAMYHTNPDFISGHLVVLSEDLFGVLFLELHSFSVFQRITENVGATKFSDIFPKN